MTARSVPRFESADTSPGTHLNTATVWSPAFRRLELDHTSGRLKAGLQTIPVGHLGAAFRSPPSVSALALYFCAARER